MRFPPARPRLVGCRYNPSWFCFQGRMNWNCREFCTISMSIGFGGMRSVCYKFYEVQDRPHGRESCRQWGQNKDNLYPPFIPEEDFIPGLAVMELQSCIWRLGPWCSAGSMLVVWIMLTAVCCPHICFQCNKKIWNSILVNVDSALQPIGSVLTAEMPAWLLWISKMCHVPCVSFRATTRYSMSARLRQSKTAR